MHDHLGKKVKRSEAWILILLFLNHQFCRAFQVRPELHFFYELLYVVIYSCVGLFFLEAVCPSAVLFQVRRHVNDVVRIYSISVTNAVDGVSSGCRACALSTQPSSSACVPCPPGHYIDTRTSQCTECPHNTYLLSRATPGPDACKSCGPASKSNKVCWCWGKQSSHFYYLFLWNFLIALLFKTHNYISVFVFCFIVFILFLQDHSLCYSDCHFTHTEGNATLTFDFSLLGSVGLLMNGPSFTSKGTKYFHQFNISLCGGQVWRDENAHKHTENTALFKS